MAARNVNQYVEVYLHKMSLLHEENAACPSAPAVQTFSIHSYEVRDRLNTSSMNKLLHLYTTRTRWDETCRLSGEDDPTNPTRPSFPFFFFFSAASGRRRGRCWSCA